MGFLAHHGEQAVPYVDHVEQKNAPTTSCSSTVRFHDQMLRTDRRQVAKRSATPHYALVDPARLTLNERRFFATEEIVPLAVPLERACEILMA